MEGEADDLDEAVPVQLEDAEAAHVREEALRDGGQPVLGQDQLLEVGEAVEGARLQAHHPVGPQVEHPKVRRGGEGVRRLRVRNSSHLEMS